MKKLLRLSFAAILFLTGCGPQNKNINPAEEPADSATQINKDSITRPGSDRDEHGCIPSAGYSWSEIKKECVRIWEAGNKFTAYGDNKDSTTAAYLITQPNSPTAELFLPGQKGSTLLGTSNESMDLKASMYICQNEDSSIYLKLYPSQAKYILYIDKKPMFACTHPLK